MFTSDEKEKLEAAKLAFLLAIASKKTKPFRDQQKNYISVLAKIPTDVKPKLKKKVAPKKTVKKAKKRIKKKR